MKERPKGPKGKVGLQGGVSLGGGWGGGGGVGMEKRLRRRHQGETRQIFKNKRKVLGTAIEHSEKKGRRKGKESDLDMNQQKKKTNRLKRARNTKQQRKRKRINRGGVTTGKIGEKKSEMAMPSDPEKTKHRRARWGA